MTLEPSLAALDRSSERTSGGRRADRNSDEGRGGRGLAVTALCVAIVSLCLCWIPIVNNVVFFLGVIALILSIWAYVRARRGKARGRGLAFAAILISVLSIAGVFATQAYYGSLFDDLEDAIAEATGDGGTSGDEPESDEADEAGDGHDVLPLGEAAKVGSEYSVAVTRVNLDADDVIARANEFNEPPAGRYVMASLDVTYLGDGEGNPWVDLEQTFAGTDARQYLASACEAVTPDEDSEVPTLTNGGKASYKVCFDLPPEAIDGGEIFVANTLSFDEKRAYWAIR